MSRFIALLCVYILLAPPAIRGQDFAWWNNRHDWDGTSPWQNYLTISPGFLGPNALPVPDLRNGSITQQTEFILAAESHFSRGDKTQNLYAELFAPLFSDRVGLHIFSVPIEYYHMTPEIRDYRRARDFDGKGTANGDIYVGTQVQLLRNHVWLPDMLLAINMRTASGNHLSAARYSDTPGYFFDLSMGKTFDLRGAITSVRPFAVAGFYVWQTYLETNPQNDAFLFGVGAEIKSGKFDINTSLGGYSGYKRDGDHPMVYRAKVTTRSTAPLNYLLSFQHGLRDCGYTSMRLGVVLRPGKIAPTKST